MTEMFICSMMIDMKYYLSFYFSVAVKKTQMLQYEEPNEKLADKSACAGVRADLKMCLLKSECCQMVCHFPLININNNIQFSV